MTSSDDPNANVVDFDALASWMDAKGLGSGPLANLTPLEGGTQNILVRFQRGTETFVLRHPPPHKRKNSDRTMQREATMLRALTNTNVPHPKLIAGEPDPVVLGSAFYLMEAVDGFNATMGLPQFHTDPQVQRSMGLSMVDGIAKLAAVDYVAVGLEDFGKVDGYLERQVGRWMAQLESYTQMDGYPGPDIPGLQQVADWLDQNRPSNWTPGIIHGDYHLANVMFRHDRGELAAIVDWELTTVGDPLLDLGWLLATWPTEGAPGSVGAAMTGLPASEELIPHYANQSSRDLSSISWYATLACYKLGIILEGTYARACAGKAPKATGDALHSTTIGLFQRALGFVQS